MKTVPITQDGFNKLQNEIKKLKFEDRKKVINEISDAREFGDLSENAEYKAAKEKQSLIENKIFNLERTFSNCEVISTKNFSSDTVKFGAFVNILSLDEKSQHCYQVVGEYESNLNEEKISITSPLARALVKKSVGDIVEVDTPKGKKLFEILSIEY